MIYIFLFMAIINIIVVLKNLKSGLMWFLIMNPLFSNPAINIINVSFLPLITLWRLVFIFLLIKFMYDYSKGKISNKLLKKYPLFNNQLFVIAIMLISFFLNDMGYFGAILKVFFQHLLLVFLIFVVIDDEKDIYKIIKGIMYVFFIFTIFGIYCKISGTNIFHTEVLDSINSSGYRNIIFGEYTSQLRAGIGQRIASFFYNPISYGAHLAIFFPYVFALFIYDKKTSKIFGFLVIILFLLNIIFTNSRTSIVVFLTVILVFFYYQPVNIKIKYLFIGMYILIFLSVNFNYLGGYGVTILSILDPDSATSSVGGSTIESRLILFQKFLKYLVIKPFWGYGVGSFSEYNKFGYGYGGKLGGENYFLFIAFEVGIIGLTIFNLLYLKIFNTLRKDIKAFTNKKYKFLSVSTLSMFIGWLVFVNITGNLNGYIFMSTMLGLGLKLNYLNKIY